MLESGIVGRALPRKREKGNEVGGFNLRAKMGSWFTPGSVLGVPNGPLMVLNDELGGPNIL